MRANNILTYGVVGAVTLSAACFPAIAGEVYYSNTCNEPGSGDVAGYVIAFTDDGRRPAISLTWSEGALMAPVQAEVTDYDRTSGRLNFVVKAPSGQFSFAGSVQPHAIEGIVSSPFNSPEHIALEERSRAFAFEPRTECAMVDRPR